jgi:hypothetical protein
VAEVFAKRRNAHDRQDRRLHPYDAELVRDVFWDLFRQGFITLGLNDSNPNWPWFRLSHFGERALKTQSPYRFHDTGSFITLEWPRTKRSPLFCAHSFAMTRKPGRTSPRIRFRPVMNTQETANNILVDLDAESQRRSAERCGNLEIATRNVVGKPTGGNLFLGIASELEYGMTGWWTTEIYLDAQSTHRDSTVLTGYRWEPFPSPTSRALD